MRWGALGAAWIAERAVLPAIGASRNGQAVAIASRSADRARDLASKFEIPRVHGSYEALLADPEIDAVYVPLVNSLHRRWCVAALRAGKHVLCEKPLALNAAEGEEMAAAAEAAGRLLMEGFMYRFHPRMRALRAGAVDVAHLAARFGFPLQAPGNYRLDPALGGGALMDVGCYGVNVARWFLGEPERISAAAHVDGVDMSVAVVLGFAGGATATVWGSFESPEDQELTLVSPAGTQRVNQPFTSWHDPDDPYQIMVEEFADAALSGTPAPISLEDSIAGLRVLDAIRAQIS
ncbi:MAG TPA: Gfo/Idh/MocA family oxidoreductase [Candidatus Dormibacteraeota bacterium]